MSNDLQSQLARVKDQLQYKQGPTIDIQKTNQAQRVQDDAQMADPGTTVNANSGSSNPPDDAGGKSDIFTISKDHLRPPSHGERYFEKRDDSGSIRRYADRRDNQPAVVPVVTMEAGDTKTTLPLNHQQHQDMIADFRQIQRNIARREGISVWTQIAHTAIAIIGAVALGYGVYRGVKHEVIKDTDRR